YTNSPIPTDPYPYSDPTLQPDLRDSNSYEAAASYPYGYNSTLPTTTSSTAPVQNSIARLTVSVPPDAEVWFDGVETSTTGPIREYQSPPLTPGTRYTCDIRAGWNEDGHEKIQTQKVEVTAGEHVSVRFPDSTSKVEQSSAVKKS